METIPVSVAALALGCSTTQVYRLLSAGYIDGFKSGKRHFVSYASLKRFKEEHTHGGRVDTSISYARFLDEHPDWRSQEPEVTPDKNN